MLKSTQAKKLYLKYENIENHIDNSFFITELQKILKIDIFIIGSENNGELNRHYKYIFIKNKDKIRKLKSKFDLEINNHIYKCIFLKVTNEKEIKKDFKWKKDLIDQTYSIENLYENNFQKENTNLINIPVKDLEIQYIKKEFLPMNSFPNKVVFINYLKNLTENLNSYELDEVLCEHYSDIFRDIGVTNMLYRMNRHYNLKKKASFINYTIDDFDLEKLKPKERDNYEKWSAYSHKYSLLIFGLSGTGKTNFALSLGEHPLLIRELNMLKNYKKGYHDIIVSDDMRFHDKSDEYKINLLDREKPSHHNVKYDTVEISEGIKFVMSSNYDADYVFGKEFMKKPQAKRRILTTKVEQPLFKEKLISISQTPLIKK